MGINRKCNFMDTTIGVILFFVATIATLAAIWFWVEDHHYKYQCSGHTTGKCGWAWCKYYDGSDYLHDFSLHGWPYNKDKKGE